ncbi:MAG: T9SS type A sorting domain-containing protein, partial [Chitinophagales bacterium]
YTVSMRTASAMNTENNFVIYPNPAHDFITIFNTAISTDETTYLISISSADGKTCYDENHQMAEKIDVSNLPSGNYICTINDGSKILNLKFVKL